MRCEVDGDRGETDRTFTNTPRDECDVDQTFYLCHKHAVHNWADAAGGTDWMGLPSPL